MAGVLQFKRSENVAAYTPKMGEPIFDISRKQFRIGNDVVAGGIVPKELFYTPITSAAEITAEADSCVIVDCRANSVKINLPAITALPSGSTVKVLDAYYAADKTNRIEVLSTAKINNLQQNFIIDLPRAYISFIYLAETQNWIVDLGGVILPSYEILTTGELEWTDTGYLGVKEVPFTKISGVMDLGTW